MLKTECTQITVKINYAEYAAKSDDVTASLNTFSFNMLYTKLTGQRPH